MQTAIENPKLNNYDPTWQLIAEFSLREETFDEIRAAELLVESLFQTIRELALPPECIKRIEGTITDTIQNTRNPFNRGLPDLPARISLFCNTEAAIRANHSGDHLNGGWGYYVVERSKDFLNAPWQEPRRVIELYLYKEGE